MKIAYVVPYVPNLIRIRPYKLIEHLSELGIEISLFTVGSSARDLKDADRLKSVCREVHYRDQPIWRSLLNCLAALPTERSLQAVYSWNPRLGMELGEHIDAASAAQGFDLVHVEHLRGARYAEFVRNRFPAVPLLWDSVDCISHLFKQAANQSRGLFGRFIAQLDIGRTQRTEGRQICQVDHVLVTSPMDRDALLALVSPGGSPAPVSVLSNGVDLDYYRQPGQIQKEVETIVFSGKMSYHANSTMAAYLVDQIMPRVWREKPSVRAVIVGKDPSPAIRKFAENPRITVTGTVDDLRPHLWKAGVAVVPLIYGAGIQNKILEAMAAGTPVVASSRTLSAMRAKAGSDLLVADRPEEFAAQILRLMANPSLYDDVRRNGLAYVETFHDWHTIAKQLVAIFRETIARKKRRSG